MRWASTLTTPARLEDAVEEGVETVTGALDGDEPDLVMVFAATDYEGHFSRLPAEIQRHFPGALLLGCSSGGVIGGGREAERETALSITAAVLPGIRLSPFHLAGPESNWQRCVGVASKDHPHFVLLPDPFTCRTEELLRWFDRVYPSSTKIGGLASGSSVPGRNALFLADRIHRSGAVGLALHGNLEVDTIVAQGCRPVGQPMFVTRAEGQFLFELDGIPATSVLEDLYNRLCDRDRALFENALFLGLVMKDSLEVYRQGDFLIRNVLGIDPERGALAIGAELVENRVVQFQLRDADTSARDLHELLERHPGPAPAGALLFSCLGRGKLLYGRPNHDSEVFASHLGPVPLGGFFCNGEIGPVNGRTFLHGYTSSFALFRPRLTAVPGAKT